MSNSNESSGEGPRNEDGHSKAAKTEFHYDSLGRVIQIVQSDGVGDSQATAGSDSQIRSVKYEYDALGRLTSVTESPASTTPGADT